MTGAILFLMVMLFLLVGAFFLQKDFFAPSVLMTASWTLAAAIVLLNVKTWNVHLSTLCLAFVVVAIMSWMAGGALVRLMCSARDELRFDFLGAGKRTRRKEVDSSKTLRKESFYFPYVEMAAISTAFAATYILLKLRTVGIGGGLKVAVRTIYESNASSGNQGGFLLNQMFHIIIAMSYICVFELCRARFVLKKQRVLLFIGILNFIVCTLISSDRNVLIRFCIYSMCIAAFFFRDTSTSSRRRINKRIFFTAVLAILMISVAFFLFGKMKQYTSNFSRSISIYMGSGLYDFNLFLDKFSFRRFQLGECTLRELRNLLRHFNLLRGSVTPLHEEFIIYSTHNGYVYASNIYSSLRPNVEDFGLFGVVLFQFIEGVFMEVLYQNALRRKRGLSWILYGKLITPAVYASIADQFYNRLNLGIAYEVFWLLVFYFIIFGLNGLWRRRLTPRINVPAVYGDREKWKFIV